MGRAFVAIGSNLGDRRAFVREAVHRLSLHPAIRVVQCSGLHETAPADGADPAEPAYLNGAIELETRLEPHDLLHSLQTIEQDLGRPAPGRPGRSGPRTLDLDLLWYEDRTCHDTELTLPHPRMTAREFVLTPLAEIAPEIAAAVRKEPI